MSVSPISLQPVDYDPAPARTTAKSSGTVAPTIAILRLLAMADQPVGVNAIARELGMAPSSCFKILKQLHAEEFADFNPSTKGYSLGSGAIVLGRRALDPTRAFPMLRPRLAEVGERFGIAIGFWRRISRGRIVLAGFIEGSSLMRIHMSLGQRLPMLVGGVGRAFAARLDLSEADLRAEFARLRWQSPVTFEEYLAQVAAARMVGFATDRNTFAPGVTTIATALPDSAGLLGFGISAIMFSGQHEERIEAEIGAALLAIAEWAKPRLSNAAS